MKIFGNRWWKCSGLLLSLCVMDRPRTSTAEPPLSPAVREIQSARDALAKHPESVKPYLSLAVGLTRRARETGDPGYYSEAGKALAEAECLSPGNPQTLRISAWVAMGRHEFDRAHRISVRYAREHGEDPWNLGVMGDSLMELGRYREAGEAFQRMVDLRPGPAAYSRIAYWREVGGDLDGAREMMKAALAATVDSEAEDRAWLMVQIGHLEDLLGDPEAAAGSYGAALAAFPGYHYALAARAELALRRKDFAEAASLAQKAIDAAPHAERYLILADALRGLGREPEAAAAEDTFETLALRNVDKADNENHDLVLCYLERRRDPGRALSIARLEAERRQDVQTLDRLAAALFANGRTGEARRLMKKVLSTGSRDPVIARHAAAMGFSKRG